MTEYRNLHCDDEERRARVLAHATLNGIDYIEVPATTLDAQRFIEVYFIKTPPPAGLVGRAELFSIEGGVRIRNIKVRNVTQVGQHLVVEVDQAGDFSPYTLVIASAGLDPAYKRHEFGFKAGCPNDMDCRPQRHCPSEQREGPLVNYMAKDYASFRQALIDLIPSLAPQWRERRAADLGMTMVELLAYAGDQLSYYQDAVANEAYLATARQRISVRRHARLVDYRLHDGASARTFVHFQLTSGSGSVPAETQLLTRIEESSGGRRYGTVIREPNAERARDEAGQVFEVMSTTTLDRRLNELYVYPWGNKQCCLPRGMTSVDLVGDHTAYLVTGDLLLFEEVVGPGTGLAADADPRHRQVVRLTDAIRADDPLTGDVLTRVTWGDEDALSFPLCLSAKLADGRYVDKVSVARGNLVLADHGHRYAEYHPGDPSEFGAHGIELGERAYRFRLARGPLSFRIPDQPGASVATLTRSNVRNGLPQVRLRIRPTATASGHDWQAVAPDLLDSGAFDRHVVVETDNEGRPLIRFGDDEYGRSPSEGSFIDAAYRIGVGKAGNIGADSLAHVIRPEGASDWPSIRAVRNPLAAWGGIDPQPIEQVKQLAPAAFQAEQYRAVTEEDYGYVAGKHPEVSAAVATFRWTGSWHTVFITIDPVGRNEVSRGLADRVRSWVQGFTQAGYDLEIRAPHYVALEIEINICVALDHFRAHVEEAVLTALTRRQLADGRLGFFHPDNFTFGQTLYVSQLYAAVEAVVGVDSAQITVFQRYGKEASGELTQGYLSTERVEVVRLDNDPNFPEHGVLTLMMVGGK